MRKGQSQQLFAQGLGCFANWVVGLAKTFVRIQQKDSSQIRALILELQLI